MERWAGCVVRVDAGAGGDDGGPGVLRVHLGDVTSTAEDPPFAVALVEVDDDHAVVRSVELRVDDAALAQRLVDGVADVLRSRGVHRLVVACALPL